MKDKNKNCKPITLRKSEFLSSNELKKMCDTDKVFVDSSTICAIVQEHAFIASKTRASIFSKMEVRMSPSRYGQKKRKDMIFFGDYVKLSIIELEHLFEDVSYIPEGTVKRVQ